MCIRDSAGSERGFIPVANRIRRFGFRVIPSPETSEENTPYQHIGIRRVLLTRLYGAGWMTKSGEGAHDPVEDLVHGALAVDLDEQAALGIRLGERTGLAVVDRHPLADDLLGVVGAALDLSLIHI